MFKDYDKYLSASLKMYIFVLIIVFILKLVGMDCFGLDLNNSTIISINNFCLKWNLDAWVSFINCFITFYIMFSLNVNENSKKVKKLVIFTFPITIAVKYSGYFVNEFIYFIIQFIYMFILIAIFQKKVNIKMFWRYIKIYLFLSIIQLISTVCRGQDFNYVEYNFIVSTLMSLDYLIMLIIIHKLYFAKGGILCHHYQEAEVGFSLPKKMNLKNLLKRLQVNLHKFKELPKQERLAISIYMFLSLLWNTLSLVIILLVANLNHTFIECLFIITSFWLSKHTFGKPFHLRSMIQCFIVSNLTYYVLNRITTPLGISIFVPILLGVGLSYVTSKLVKKTYKPLYRGMPKDLFEETILKVVDKDSLKYKICYGFYINKKSDLALSFEYNYSLAGIRKIKDRINAKIKELN